MAEKHDSDQRTYTPGTLRTGRPDTAEPPYLGNFVPQPLKNELFPEEWEALQKLKEEEVSHYFNDRFLAAFLLARKLDIKRTKKLLQSNIKWRKDNGYENIPSFDSLNKDVILSGFGQKIPGARDKQGCGLLFCKLGQMHPDDFKQFDLLVTNWVIWNNAEGNLWEDMDFHRNGLTFVFDLTDIGWKNVDLGLQRRINATLMDNFPMRVTKILVVNPPMIFKSLLAAARLIIKKKVMDRLQVLESLDQVKLHVDEDVLPTAFGGKNTHTMQDFLRFVEKVRVAYPLELAPISLSDEVGNKLGSSKKSVKKTTSAATLPVAHQEEPHSEKKKTPSSLGSSTKKEHRHHHHHHRDKGDKSSDKSTEKSSDRH